MDIDEDFDVDETTSGDDGIEDDGQSLEANQSYKKLARYKKLGFHPQKEIYCNKYLPYAEHLDDESQRMLADVKEYLAVAVASREMVPAIANAVKRLIIYIKLYGLKFSKDDHIKFIKVLLSLIEIPDLEPSRLNQFCVAFSQLLRKTSWLSPNDLQIDWRPLYNLSVTFLNKNSTKGELYRYFPSLESNVQFIIQQCATYFPKSSTAEILDELYPKLYPLDTGKICGAFDMLSIFLNPNHGHELWLKDFMHLWDTYHNPSWNVDMMNLIAITANQNVGYIDWEPYIPIIFSRIMRSIDLPVCYKNMKSARNQSLWSSSVAIWIVSVLGPKTSGQQYLTQLLGAIETYLHPANMGKWVNAISEIIVQIPKYLFDRLIVERYKPHTWKRPVPADHKLTEECLTKFVESFKPIALQAMYSRMNAPSVGKIFKHLADLRPEMIVPDVIDRVYSTLDSLTEPHKMTAALQCLVSVARAMVSGHNGYTTGKTHVIPILYATLPGIDPNDFRKTSVTLQFLTSFALLVPIIDCSTASQYYDDLTDEELLICGQTAEFEAFVLQYLDKIFALIESSGRDVIRMEQSDEGHRSKLETIAESLLQSSTHGILGQCSKEIIASATRKLVDFVKTNLFEPRVAAHLVASLLRVFARVAGAEIHRTIVPYLVRTINQYMDDHDDIDGLDKQSDEMQYYIVLLMSVVRGDPYHVTEFTADFVPIIDRISKFKCNTTNKYSNAILIHILSNISTIQTLDVRSSPESYEQHLKDFLPIRHWGQKMKSTDVGIKWYVPDDRPKAVCQMLLHRYLPPILEQFERYCAGDLSLSRDEILRDTSTVLALLKCANFLPNWMDQAPLQPFECNNDIRVPNIDILLGFEKLQITMPDGRNIRTAIIDTIAKLQEKILRDTEDDTKSLKAIIMLWERVFIRKQYVTPIDSQLKSYNALRTFQEYSLTRHKRDIRAILATRVLMQQDYRDEVTPPQFTDTHRQVMLKLLHLSTSHYSAVRLLAQSKLFGTMTIFPYAYRLVVDDVVKYLELDANEHHEQFKGILYVIGGQRRSRLIVKNDWECVQKIWLAMLRTNLSEKPSVVRLLDMINDAIHKEFPTVAIDYHIPDECVQLAKALLSTAEQRAAGQSAITDDTIARGLARFNAHTARSRQLYHDILQEILQITHNTALHWRYGLMASSMLYNLVQPTASYPPSVINYCVNNLISESIEERKYATKTMRYIFKQRKREHIKVVVDPFEVAGVAAPHGERHRMTPGPRADNRWLQYELATLPHSQAEWDAPTFSHKSVGFFGWSPNFSVYAPNAQQPRLNRTPAELDDAELLIYAFFAHKPNIDKLIGFWSLEEKKGNEKFNRSRSFLLKGLCDLYGDVLLEPFYDHLKRLIDDKNSESSHRCAAELMAGIMRGMKHWTFDMTERAYAQLKPLIRLALNNITVETDVLWGTCFATAAENFDPRRQYWLHEVLMEDPLRQSTSFIDCSRIYCLQGPFNQHVWRMNSVSHRLLAYLRPYLNHSFQNVRDRLGSILINIFEADLKFHGAHEPECPRIKDFVTDVMATIQVMHTEMPTTIPMDVDSADPQASGATDTEYDKAVRLFKTVCQWIIGVLNRNTNGNMPEFFELLPIACRLERCEQDTELAEACTSLLAMISQALTLPNCIDVALQKIDEVSLMSSWSARLSVIDVLQVLVFNSMPIVLSQDAWVQHVQTIVLRLLEDAVLEVREKAAQVLGGLLHCAFLPATDQLLELFKRKCRTKVVKNASRRVMATTCGSDIDRQDAESVRIRHMGVLGLCAFISAYPYDIPDFVPDVFEHLGAHLNDPQPIPSTIRKTVGDFKRTHHDNWATHQLKFTEDQLAVLSDLTIPPSYYA